MKDRFDEPRPPHRTKFAEHEKYGFQVPWSEPLIGLLFIVGVFVILGVLVIIRTCP